MPADKLDIPNEYIKSFFAKKTYLERNDQKLFKKIVENLTWVKQLRRRKPPIDGGNGDPLLGKNDNQIENKNDDRILVEAKSEKSRLGKLTNKIEMDEDCRDSDEESVIPCSYSDDEADDQFLAAGHLEHSSKKREGLKNLEILVEVHNIDVS